MVNSCLHVSRASSGTNGLGAENALSCLVCGGTYRRSRLPGLFQCDTCGFVSADLSIPDDDLRALYGADYFHGHEYLDYLAEEEIFASTSVTASKR